jgi:hypothetical protein
MLIDLVSLVKSHSEFSSLPTLLNKPHKASLIVWPSTSKKLHDVFTINLFDIRTLMFTFGLGLDIEDGREGVEEIADDRDFLIALSTLHARLRSGDNVLKCLMVGNIHPRSCP